MNFTTIAAGASVFIDANVFVYDFGPDPLYGPACNALLRRLESNELRGYTSSLCIHNFAHRAMTVEACATFGWSYSGVGRKLKSKPAEIEKLTRFRTALEAILLLGVIVLPVSARDVTRAAEVSQKHGLLSGDALIVAMMQSNGFVNLASNDVDFDRVPDIVRYGPL